LFKDGSHPTAEELYQHMKREMPDISRTTIYNTLSALDRMGLIDTVHNRVEESARYDPNTDTHHHLLCTKCGKMVDVDVELQDVRLSRTESRGFQLHKKQMTFFGLCPECQQKESGKL